MRTAWRLGRIKGIEINIDSSWVIIFVLVTFTLGGLYFPDRYQHWPRFLHWVIGFITSILFFASVFGHELSHSLAALRQGQKVRSITLFIFGGVAQISEEPDSPRKEFFMAIMGPVASLAIASVSGFAWLALRDISEPAAALTKYLAYINLVLAGFNLLPGLPLDGGRVLRSMIWAITGDYRRATRVASGAGQIIAFMLILIGVWQIFSGSFEGLWLLFIGWFLQNAAIRGYHQAVVKDLLQGIKAEDIMDPHFETVDEDITLRELVDNYILRRRERAFLVLDRGNLKGIICLDDVRGVPKESWETTYVRDVMTPEDKLEVVSPRDDGNTVLVRLNSKDVHQLPVVDGGRVVGVLCRSDVIRFLQLHTELGS